MEPVVRPGQLRELVLLRAILGGVVLLRWNEDGIESDDARTTSLVAEWIRVASYARHLQESIGWWSNWS